MESGPRWFKTATWNLALSNAKGRANWLKRRSKVISMIESFNADIVCFQEYGQASWIESQLKALPNRPLTRIPTSPSKAVRLFASSKVTVVESGGHKLAASYKGNTRYLAWAVVEIDKAVAVVVGFHAEYRHTSKASQARLAQGKETYAFAMALAKKHNIGNSRVFILGDFNESLDAPLSKWLTARGMPDIAKRATTKTDVALKSFTDWKTPIKGKRIDHIRVGGTRPSQAFSQRAQTGISDHLPQVAIINRKPK